MQRSQSFNIWFDAIMTNSMAKYINDRNKMSVLGFIKGYISFLDHFEEGSNVTVMVSLINIGYSTSGVA